MAVGEGDGSAEGFSVGCGDGAVGTSVVGEAVGTGVDEFASHILNAVLAFGRGTSFVPVAQCTCPVLLYMTKFPLFSTFNKHR